MTKLFNKNEVKYGPTFTSRAYFLIGKQGDSPSRFPDQATNVKIFPDREVF
jgi:hypothetical protein